MPTKPAVAQPDPTKGRSSGARSIDAIRTAVLLRASARADLEVVQILIDAGADVNCRDTDGLSPLHLACHAHALDVCFALIEAGARLDARSVSGRTPLHHAVAECGGRVELVALLRSRGADADAPDARGVTPGQLAQQLGCPI
jgi:ankyrin repeat protein